MFTYVGAIFLYNTAFSSRSYGGGEPMLGFTEVSEKAFNRTEPGAKLCANLSETDETVAM